MRTTKRALFAIVTLCALLWMPAVGGVLLLISAAKPAGTPLRTRRRPPSRRKQTRERCLQRTVFPIPEFTAEDSRRDY